VTSVADTSLTVEQRRAVDEDDRAVRITGAAGTGKTTALQARYRRLVASHPASAVLVVCRTRLAADRFLDAVLPELSGGFDSVPVTTFHGLAHDVVTRYAGPVRLLTAAEQRQHVRRLLAADGADQWPSLQHLRDRRAFVRQVSDALLARQASLLDDDELLARAEAAGVRARWEELLAFARRYQTSLAAEGSLDQAGLLATAVELLGRSDVGAAEQGRFAHVLVDDYQEAAVADDRLLSRLAQMGARVTVAGDPAAASGMPSPPAGGGAARFLHNFAARFDAVDVALTRPFRAPAAPVLVSCGHPAVEPEAVAGVLLAAHDEGVRWGDMALLVRRRGERATAIARALARHGIPTARLGGTGRDEPAVRAVLDVLRWAGGDAGALERLLPSPVAGLGPAEVRAVRQEAAREGIPLDAHPRLAALVNLRRHLEERAPFDTPSELAFEVWRRTLAHLADSTGPAGQRTLDALATFFDGLRRRAERRPHERLAELLAADADDPSALDAWRSMAATAAPDGAVAITPIDATSGREWHTVVVAGCVEGELPAVHSTMALFDPMVLHAAGPVDARQQRRAVLDGERRLFRHACSRATGRLVATAAPEPGVLLSRFVEGWPTAPATLPLAPGPDLVARAPTPGAAAVTPTGQLRLSASQLATYDDCPLRYAYEYVLGARGEPGVRADLGSLVHEVLAAFLDPAADLGFPRTRDGLRALAEQRWRDDIAPYRPQIEEARRDFFAMLDAWWEAEGSQEELAPQVLAVERRFEVDVGPHRLSGAIDRIDRADDGAGIRIVDYKTGKAEPSPDDVAHDLQLAVYHVAASRDPELAGLGRPTQLRLLYLRTMNCYDQEVSADHEAVTEARVLERAARIEAEEFEPSVEATCRTCSFQRVCPLHDEGRQLA
jgi:superfamily I DNA/RNA helicase/RecB family exonuclease